MYACMYVHVCVWCVRAYVCMYEVVSCPVQPRARHWSCVFRRDFSGVKRTCWTTGSWRSCLSLEVVSSIPAWSTIIYRFLCGFICVSLCQSIKIKPTNMYVCMYVCMYIYIYVCVLNVHLILLKMANMHKFKPLSIGSSNHSTCSFQPVTQMVHKPIEECTTDTGLSLFFIFNYPASKYVLSHLC